MSKKILFSLIAVFLSLNSVGFAYDNWGASVAATGMGGAYVAIAGDPANIFYNPAGLARINQYMLYGMYNRQTTVNYLLDEKPYALATAGAWPFYWGTLGLGLAQRGSWSEPTQVVTHNVLTLSYSRFISPQVSFGTSAKYLFNTNYGDKSGADFDLGFMYFATPQLTFGLAGENLFGTDVEPDAVGTYFFYNRRQVKLGASYELLNGEYRTRFGFDTIFKEKKGLVTDGNNINNFGIEQSVPFSPYSTVSFRAGYSLGKDYNQDFNAFAFGISYELRNGDNLYRFDYSYQDYPFETTESFAGDNRFAFTVAFGAPKHGDGYAKHKEDLNLVSVNKPAKTEPVPEKTYLEPLKKEAKPVESKADKRTSEQSVFKQEKKSDQPGTASADTKQEKKPAQEMKAPPSSTLTQAKPEEDKTASKTTVAAITEAEKKASQSSVPVTKEEKKTAYQPAAQVKPEAIQTAPPATTAVETQSEKRETKPSTPVVQKEDKPVSQPVVQVTPEEKKTIETPETQTAPAEIKNEALALVQQMPEEKQTVFKATDSGIFKNLKITSRVEASQARSAKDKSYMFVFKYNIEEEQRFVSEWRILVTSSPSNSFLAQGTDPNLLQSINGRGIPPAVIVWNAKDRSGSRVAPGKYYYALYLKSNQGEKFLSAWSPMMVE